MHGCDQVDLVIGIWQSLLSQTRACCLLLAGPPAFKLQTLSVAFLTSLLQNVELELVARRFMPIFIPDGTVLSKTHTSYGTR